MVDEKKKKKTEEKHPLDMTTDEAMKYLFGQEGAEHLKKIAHATNSPQNGDDNKPKGKGDIAQEE